MKSFTLIFCSKAKLGNHLFSFTNAISEVKWSHQVGRENSFGDCFVTDSIFFRDSLMNSFAARRVNYFASEFCHHQEHKHNFNAFDDNFSLNQKKGKQFAILRSCCSWKWKTKNQHEVKNWQNYACHRKLSCQFHYLENVWTKKPEINPALISVFISFLCCHQWWIQKRFIMVGLSSRKTFFS